MAVKQVTIDDIGEVSLYKRRGVQAIRLSVTSAGAVRVSLPTWVPYAAAIRFVMSRADWIREHKAKQHIIQDGAPVGKAHHIHFVITNGARVTTRVRENQVIVSVPGGVDTTDVSVQKAAERASLRALRFEAETLLPKRLALLAQQHGFTYRSVNIKQMKGRWGSCSQYKDIVLNCYLMQLPWEHIDYVLLHELTHTRIMAHGAPFWDELGKYVHNLPEIRKQMRAHQPVI